jgi:hypothetical protein
MRFARALLIIICSAACLTGQVIPVYQVVVDSDPVSVNVVVSDPAGRSVTGLTREDFSVLEDDQPQAVREIKPVGIPQHACPCRSKRSR